LTRGISGDGKESAMLKEGTGTTFLTYIWAMTVATSLT
jgi:hypothetical protein